MNVSFRELRKKDEKKIIKFASEGMHLDRFVKNPALRHLCNKLYWYSNAFKATQIITAYENDAFLGVLAASINGKKTCYRNPLRYIFFKLTSFFINMLESDDNWYSICHEMYKEYTKNTSPDGEILFFVTSPKVKGVGSILLSEFKRRNDGKTIFLYTDEWCNYGFYDHMGFKRLIEKNATIRVGRKNLSLKCFLYSTKLSASENEPITTGGQGEI